MMYSVAVSVLLVHARRAYGADGALQRQTPDVRPDRLYKGNFFATGPSGYENRPAYSCRQNAMQKSLFVL